MATGRALLLLVSGVLTPNGATVRSMSKQVSGQLAPAGALAQHWHMALGARAASALVAQVFGISNVRLSVAFGRCSGDGVHVGRQPGDNNQSARRCADTPYSGETLYEQL